MKTITAFLLAAFTVGMSLTGTAQSEKTVDTSVQPNSQSVAVYYFHFTRRCATCNAVESVTKEAIKEYYGDKVTFADYNLDEETGEAKGKELEVSGQTLLIVAGSTHINITNEGFMNARSKPEKLKAIIKEKIDPLL